LEKLDFKDHESMETKIVHLRTHHGFDFAVNLYNSESVSHFGCPNWEALCKIYDFHEGMLVTLDLHDPDKDNMDIWVLVDTLSILPLCEFLKHSY
jgi:hypothetical protein